MSAAHCIYSIQAAEDFAYYFGTDPEVLTEVIAVLSAFALTALYSVFVKPRRKPQYQSKICMPEADPGLQAGKCNDSSPGCRASSPLTWRSEPHRVSMALGEQLAMAAGEGRIADLPRLVDAASKEESTAFGPAQLMHVIRCCTRDKRYAEAIACYDRLIGLTHVDRGAIPSILLYSAVEAQVFDRCEEFYRELTRWQAPQGNDFVNMVRYLATAERRGEKGVARLKAFLRECQSLGFVLDPCSRNRALAVCCELGACASVDVLASFAEAAGQPLDVVAFNMVMKTHTRAGEHKRCLAVMKTMQEQGVTVGEVTLGIALDACVSAGDLSTAERLYSKVKAEGCSVSKVTLTTLMKGMAAAGRFAEARGLLDQMEAPDLVAYTTLMKALCWAAEASDAGVDHVHQAVQLMERMIEQSVQPDDIACNILFGGARTASDAKSALRVFALVSGEKPKSRVWLSAPTLSVFLKACTQCGHLDEALAALESLQRSHADVQIRHYSQLCMANVYWRKGGGAIAVYDAMARVAASTGQEIDEATNARLVGYCKRMGMAKAASEMARHTKPLVRG